MIIIYAWDFEEISTKFRVTYSSITAGRIISDYSGQVFHSLQQSISQHRHVSAKIHHVKTFVHVRLQRHVLKIEEKNFPPKMGFENWILPWSIRFLASAEFPVKIPAFLPALCAAAVWFRKLYKCSIFVQRQSRKDTFAAKPHVQK